MKKHYAAAISAFTVWGFFAIPLRALKEFSSGEILYFRILFSSLFLLAIVATFKKKDLKKDLMLFASLSKKSQREVIGLTLAGGVLLTVNWLIFIYIVNNINIKTASFSYLICPVITAVLGYLLIKEKLTNLQWVAVALCAVSCIFMGFNSTFELGFSFVTAITYALYLITQRRNQGFDRMIMLCVQVLFSFLILNMFYPQLITSVPVSSKFYFIIVTIALVFTVLPLFLNLFALNRINSATIGILMYINPLINFSVAFLVFNESISSIQIFGYLIIAMALILFNIPTVKKIKGAIHNY